MTESALVTGATGFIGGRVAEALLARGTPVRALVRDPARLPGTLAGRVDPVVGEIDDPDAVAGAAQGAGLVVHCAAVTTNNVPWTVHQRVNVDGTRIVLEQAERAGARRVVHLSSIAVYGPSPGPGLVAEDHPYGDEEDRWAYYQRSKIAADRLALAARGVEVAVVRPGIVHGPGHPGVGPDLADLGPVRLMVGSLDKALPLVHVVNVVDAILLAAEVPGAAGRAYNVVDDPQPTVRAVAARVAALSGDRKRLVPVPPRALDAAAAVLERRRARAGGDVPPKLSRFQIAQRARDARFSTEAARRELGWAPRLGPDEGLRDTLGIT